MFLHAVKVITQMTGTYRLVKRSRIGSYCVKRLISSNLGKLGHGKGITIEVNGLYPNIVISINCGDRRVLLSEKQVAYCPDVINDFDYYFNAVHYRQKRDWREVDYSSPQIHVLSGVEQPFFFTSLAEPSGTTDIYLAKAKLSEGDTVFDLGAYCGVSTWAFSRAVGTRGRVIAFEPDNDNFKALMRNTESYVLSNVTAVNSGVWSSTGKLMFQGEGCMGSAVSSILGRDSNVYEVPVESLPDACRRLDIQRINLIKMDIEGAEIEVIKSSLDLLAHFRPSMIIEPHAIDGVVCTDTVIALLESIGYVCEIIPQCDLPLPLVYAAFRKL